MVRDTVVVHHRRFSIFADVSAFVGGKNQRLCSIYPSFATFSPLTRILPMPPLPNPPPS